MARLPNTATKQERVEAHVAKIAGKRYDRARHGGARSEITTRAAFRRIFGYTSIARRNRHTNKPHEHAREIMRNTMTIAERRAFAASVAVQLGLAA